jgi:hypothetical protein
MLDETMLKKQNRRDKLLVLLFLYNKNMKMKRPRTDRDVAVYGITFRAGLGSLAFIMTIWLVVLVNERWWQLFNCVTDPIVRKKHEG